MNLKQYIRGNRKGKSARDLEREALNDPFLNDAIDGYDAVPGDHSPRLENLRRKVSRSSLERSDFRRLAGLVAGLLVLFTVNFFLNRDEKPEMTAMDATMEQAVSVPVDTEKVSRTEMPQPLIAKAEQENRKEAIGSGKENTVIRKKIAVEPETGNNVFEEPSLLSAGEMMEDEAESVIKTGTVVQNQAVNKRMSAVGAMVTPLSSRGARGIVTDESGNPLAGVTVQVKNSEVGTVTSLDGKFSIPVTGKDSLRFSFIGYEAVDIKPDMISPMNVAMTGDKVVLGESTIVKSVRSKGQALVPVIGWKEYHEYLKREMQLPEDSCRNVSGVVSVAFEINEQGRPVNIEILKPLCPSLDQEAIRLLKNGVAWKGSVKSGWLDVRF